jgi:2-polyprenyl-3-methyl-5-hydroxy-6-metoxy-1,4-benzoquinol methylase
MGQELRIDTPAGVLPACNLCGGHVHRHVFRKNGFDLVECTDCGLAFVANPPSDEAVAGFYDGAGEYHSELLDPADPGFQRMRGVARQHLKVLLKSVPDPARLKLLDIGCSNGLFLAEARGAGFAVRGVELSPVTATFAREHFALNVSAGSWRDAGIAEGSLDVITLFDVIEHMPDPLVELKGIRRLLKPGGLLLQSTPNIDGLFPRVSQPFAELLDYWPHPEPPHHLYQFSVATLAALTAKAGFEPGRVDQTRIGLDYSFGTPKHWRVSKKLVPYALAFAPFAVIGPWIGRGDWFYLAARKPVD